MITIEHVNSFALSKEIAIETEDPDPSRVMPIINVGPKAVAIVCITYRAVKPSNVNFVKQRVTRQATETTLTGPEHVVDMLPNSVARVLLEMGVPKPYMCLGPGNFNPTRCMVSPTHGAMTHGAMPPFRSRFLC